MNDEDIIRYLRGTASQEVLLSAVEQGGLDGSTFTRTSGDEVSLTEAGDELHRLAVVHQEKSWGGAHLTPNDRGRRIAQRIAHSLESGEDRFDAVTRAIADYLQTTGYVPSETFEVDGRNVSPQEFEVAVDRLERWKCAKASRNAGNRVVSILPLPRVHEIPAVLGLLRDHFEGQSVGSVDQSTHSNTHIGDGSTVGAVSTGSPGSIQNVTITTSQRTEILERIQHVREQMGEDAAPALVQAVEAIEAEARSDGATKESIGQRAQAALVSATTTAVVNGLINLLPAAW